MATTSKRERNKIGQFISISSVAKNQKLPFERFFHKVFSSLMVIFLFILSLSLISFTISPSL